MEKKTHCIRGHEFTPENTYIDLNGWRYCRICVRARGAGHRERNPEKMQTKRRKSQDGLRYGRDYDRDVQLAAQGGACEICGRTDCTWGKGWANKWHTDHKHGQEGTHRGVLCGRCNTALGNLEPHMDRVIAYLAKYAAEQGASREGSDT
jgi:hypothetical protein